jgi:hypothetical protein
MARYSYAIGSGADGSALQQEFKLLVREAHKRGIEVRVRAASEARCVQLRHRRRQHQHRGCHARWHERPQQQPHATHMRTHAPAT